MAFAETRVFSRAAAVTTAHTGIVSQGGRITYNCLSLVCMLLIGILFGIRIRHLRLNDICKMNTIRLLVVAIYIFAMALVFSLSMLSGGIGLTSLVSCKVSLMVCLIFYVGDKILMYLFLVERAHALRAPRYSRLKDWVWLVGIFIVATGFGAIVVVAFLFPKLSMNPIRGTCHIGAPKVVTIPLLIYDICINVALTGLFTHFLIPSLRFRFALNNREPKSFLRRRLNIQVERKPRSDASRSLTPVDGVHGRTENSPQIPDVIEKLLKKSLLGAFLVLLPTMVNMVLLLVFRGEEEAWLCFSLCTLDVAWAVCVTHWMTVDPLEVEAKPQQRDTPTSFPRLRTQNRSGLSTLSLPQWSGSDTST